MTLTNPEAIVIGASAGALDALSFILPSIPRDFGLPIIIVVHIPPDKRSILAELFRAKCHIEVVEVEDKEPIRPGTAYFAPPDYHLLVESKQMLGLTNEEPILFSRPSIDVMFESASEVYRDRVAAVLLTGANQDGAKGLKIIFEAGGQVIIQDPKSSFASAMPEAGIRSCPQASVLSLNAISEFLRRIG